MLRNYKNMPDCHYEVNDEKWQKWQKMTKKLIKNETGDWNITKMRKNDKVSSWEKMTKYDKSWHKRDPRYVWNLMRYLDMNYLIFKMLKNAKKAKCDRPTDRQTNRPTDQPTDTVSCRVACTRLKNCWGPLGGSSYGVPNKWMRRRKVRWRRRWSLQIVKRRLKKGSHPFRECTTMGNWKTSWTASPGSFLG